LPLEDRKGEEKARGAGFVLACIEHGKEERKRKGGGLHRGIMGKNRKIEGGGEGKGPSCFRLKGRKSNGAVEHLENRRKTAPIASAPEGTPAGPPVTPGENYRGDLYLPTARVRQGGGEKRKRELNFRS